MNTTIISAEWLNQNLSDSELIILDASQVKDEAQHETIPGALRFDLSGAFSDPESEFPNTLPSQEQFEAECQKLGINSNSKLVVFDNTGIFFGPRVWWMFRTMGHYTIAVLDGGLPEWKNLGYATQTGFSLPSDKGNFKAVFNEDRVMTYDYIVDNLTQLYALVVDARSEGRFNGTAPEPRAGIQSGHIPMSINVPYTEVLHNGKFKSKEELTEVLYDVEMETRSVAFTCGSGVTACILLLATALISEHEMMVYDGSWTEWAVREKLVL